MRDGEVVEDWFSETWHSCCIINTETYILPLIFFNVQKYPHVDLTVCLWYSVVYSKFLRNFMDFLWVVFQIFGH